MLFLTDNFSSFSRRDMHESSLSKQREDLREWEQKLQEGEERLAELRRLLNQREKRANEYDNLWKQKQKELEVVQKKVDVANLSLKEKEEDMSRRQASLSSMEKVSFFLVLPTFKSLIGPFLFYLCLLCCRKLIQREIAWN